MLEKIFSVEKIIQESTRQENILNWNKYEKNCDVRKLILKARSLSKFSKSENCCKQFKKDNDAHVPHLMHVFNARCTFSICSNQFTRYDHLRDTYKCDYKTKKSGRKVHKS